MKPPHKTNVSSKVKRLRPGRRGFTLIEILSGISVIAVLSALLVPTVGGSLRKANSAKCLSNLHSLSQTYLLYVAENDGRLLAPLDGSAGQHDTDQTGAWQINLERYLTTAPEGSAVKRLEEFVCPDVPKAAVTGSDSTYGFNDYVCELNATLPGPTRLIQITAPSQMVLFGDARVVNNRVSSRVNSGFPPVAWHDGKRNDDPSRSKANVAFADGHVAQLDRTAIPALKRNLGAGTEGSKFWLGF